MSRRQPDDFYVGYQPHAPPVTASFVRRVVVWLFVGVAVLAVMLATSQAPFSRAVFEYGVIRSFDGEIAAEPVPSLLVTRPGVHGEHAPTSRYYLTVFGKHGADEPVAVHDGGRVTLDGSLVYSHDQTMIEVVGGSIQSSPADPLPAVSIQELGSVTLSGEIVDSKCFLGVMIPGDLKPHRACAARCISGGVPPMLVVRDALGPVLHVLLVGVEGEPVHDAVIPFVAEPVEVSGNLERVGDVFVLRMDPRGIRRLL